jgi:aldose 1-epimerase
MSQPIAPSGQQWPIRHGDHEAVVVEVGGGLRSYRKGERPILDGYDVTAMADGARCQTLAPWPNRVQDGIWHHDGARMQLSLTEPEQHNAIHGLVRWAAWSVVERTDAAVTVSCASYPQPGYPFTIRVTNAWSLSDAGLAVVTTIVNHGDRPAPVACGFHPYITAGTPTIDTATLHLPADSYLPTGEQQIPSGRESVAGTPFDFRDPHPIGDQQMDHPLTDLARDADGRFRIRLTGEHEVTVWMDEAYPYVEVFSGDALPDPARRRQGLAVEPMSAPPNALVTGEDLVWLAPEQSWRGTWGIDPSPVG